jgi:hypothetical protein
MALQTSGQARTGITPLGVKKSRLKDNKLPLFPALHEATSELRCLKTLAGYLTVIALLASVELSFEGVCLLFLCQSISLLRINRSTGGLIRFSAHEQGQGARTAEPDDACGD